MGCIMNSEEAEVFSDKLACRARMYFFDVKQSVDGSRYLSIRERTRRGPKWRERGRIIVRETDLVRFQEAIRNVGEFLGSRKTMDLAGASKASPGESLQDMRKAFPQAYAPWTPEADDRIKVGVGRRETVASLALALGRQPSAIRSRIRKLNLVSDCRATWEGWLIRSWRCISRLLRASR